MGRRRKARDAIENSKFPDSDKLRVEIRRNSTEARYSGEDKGDWLEYRSRSHEARGKRCESRDEGRTKVEIERARSSHLFPIRFPKLLKIYVRIMRHKNRSREQEKNHYNRGRKVRSSTGICQQSRSGRRKRKLIRQRERY